MSSSVAFALWAPKLFDFYAYYLVELFASNPLLRRIFTNSIFTVVTFNFGPQTVCKAHLDHLNLAFGWCSVLALGKFNPKRGGHLVLWEPKLIIEFPAGSTILLPSAAIRHSNLPIRKHETRYSMTQYCAGGLFRWVAYGFRLAEDFASQDPVGKHIVDSYRKVRWTKGVELFSKLHELVLC